MYLLDSYRDKNSIVLWIKDKHQDKRLVFPFKTYFYLDITKESTQTLQKLNYPHTKVTKLNYHRTPLTIYKVTVNNIAEYNLMVRKLEAELHYQVPMYNADIQPEHLFLYEKNLTPCSEVDKNFKSINRYATPPLTKINIDVTPNGPQHKDTPIKFMRVNGKLLKGDEKEALTQLKTLFENANPDVVIIPYAFSRLPYLAKRLEHHNIPINFHRWDSQPVTYKGGRPFFSYGKVRYQDYSFKLKGRFLIDSSSMVGQECDVDGIIELVQLTGVNFQQVAARSFGAAFQGSLVRELIKEGYLVNYKEKPINTPLSMFNMLKSDRGGHIFDAKIGFHKDVAEIDFSSMFPWIIWNKNLSADTIMSNEPPFEYVPGIPVRVSHKHKGMTPKAIKPIIDRRMYYKENPTALNKARSIGLKWILVTSYGYLRFREFKLGIASAHMAICAYAREILVETAKLAEQKGFEVVHGIIDSLYIKKKNISEDEVKALCQEIQEKTKIPISFEGIFNWIVFLPSVNNDQRPVPTKYYGLFQSGDFKVRGIELRQRSAPRVIKKFQQEILEIMAKADTKKDILYYLPLYGRLLRYHLEELTYLNPKDLAVKISLSKTKYKNNIPQRLIVQQLQKKGVTVQPGQTVSFIHSSRGPILPEDYNGKPDYTKYKDLFVRALHVVLQPFGITKEDIVESSSKEIQKKIPDYIKVLSSLTTSGTSFLGLLTKLETGYAKSSS